MYKIGKACSQCPENTCCGRQCELAGVRNDFDGLCSEYASRFKCSSGNYPLYYIREILHFELFLKKLFNKIT